MRLMRSFIALAIVGMAAGCSGAHFVVPQAGQRGGLYQPSVVQKGKAPTNWTTFSPPNSGGLYVDVVVGPDKAIWFTEGNFEKLTRVTMGGTAKLFSSAVVAGYIAVGADKKFYVTNAAFAQIGTVTVNGVSKAFTVPSGDLPSGLTLGPDNNVWFVESNHVGKITKSGVITEYALPTQRVNVGAITAGSDGKLWFTEYSGMKIGSVTTSGTVKEYSLPASPQCNPRGIVAGPDHNLWFRCGSNVGRITTSGVIKLIPAPDTGNNALEDMAIGPDGNPWFTGDGTAIHEIDTKTLKITDYTPPNIGYSNYTLVTGPDKNVWVGAYQNVINVYIPHPLTVAPKSIAFTAIGQMSTLTATQSGTNAWTATSSNSNVASVKQGSAADKFIVTSVGSGHATVTINDAIGNSF